MTSLSSIHEQCDKLIEGPPPSWDQVYAAQRAARALKIAMFTLGTIERNTGDIMARVHCNEALAAIAKEFE